MNYKKWHNCIKSCRTDDELDMIADDLIEATKDRVYRRNWNLYLLWLYIDRRQRLIQKGIVK